MVLAAFVAVTVQVPAEVADSVVPETEQPADPALKANDTAPPPDPPDVASATVEPYVPDVDVTIKAA